MVTMRQQRFTCRILLIAGVVALVHFGGHAQEVTPVDWSALLRVCTESGLGSAEVQEIIRRCRSQDFSVEEARTMLAHACAGSRAGLPSTPILSKIEEGLAKRVPAQALASAAEQRVLFLGRARDIAESSGVIVPDDEVVVAAALAMESGLEEAVIEAVFAAGRGKRPAEIGATIQAGESLRLEGFGPEDIGPILTDCLNRNLRRLEIRRVVRYALQQRARGMTPRAIRQSLWGNATSQPDAGARARSGAGQEGAPGHGPGPGGPPHGRPGQP
jgi:DNA-binding transcriptional MerR regulator